MLTSDAADGILALVRICIEKIMGKPFLCDAGTDGRVDVRRVERVSLDSGK